MAASEAHADSWLLPKRQKFFSPDKIYRVEVIPNTDAKHGANASTARAVFSVRGSLGRYRPKARFALFNSVAPVRVIVSGDGKYLAAFDNWYRVGYGDNVVAIYRTDGALIAKFGLEDLFTAEDIQTFPKSVSSIWWGQDHRLNGQNQLVLRCFANGKSEYGELLIDLATGKPVEPKRHLLSKSHPSPHVIRLLPAPEPLPAPSTDPGLVRCAEGEADRFDAEGRVNLPSKQVVRAAKSPLPFVYPPLARAARIQGVVVADILLNAAGRVTCARIRSGHPLIRGAALDGLLAQQFEAGLVTGPPVASAVMIEFLLATPER